MPFAFAGRLLPVDPLSFVAWFCLSVCNKVWCRLLHLWHNCFEHVWALKHGCKQLKQSHSFLAWLKCCLGCSLRNLSHLKSLCGSLHEGHFVCTNKLQCMGLLTLAPADCGDHGGAVTVLGACVFWSNSYSLLLVPRKVINSVNSGMSWWAVYTSNP